MLLLPPSPAGSGIAMIQGCAGQLPCEWSNLGLTSLSDQGLKLLLGEH